MKAARLRVFCIGYEPGVALSLQETERLIAGADLCALRRDGFTVGRRYLIRELDLGQYLPRGQRALQHVRCVAVEAHGKVAILETEVPS